MGNPINREVAHLANLLVEKVWQGNHQRYGLAEQCASVCVAGMQDYAWELSAEWAAKTGGREE